MGNILALALPSGLLEPVLVRWFEWSRWLTSTPTYWCSAAVRVCLRAAGGAVAPVGGDAVISTSWLQKVLRRNGVIGSDTMVADVSASFENLGGGFVGAMARLTITYAGKNSGAPTSMIMKSTKNTANAAYMSHMLGTTREVRWCKENCQEKLLHIPTVYHADYSSWTGEYLLLMEDVAPAITVSGILGNQCWGSVAADKLPAGVTMFDAASAAFITGAEVHAIFWNDRQTLLQKPWLKNVNWLQGRDRSSFEYARHMMKAKWEVIKAAVHGKRRQQKEYTVNWSPRIIKMLEESIKNSTWELFLKEMHDPSRALTLTHGDFHAGNMLWKMKKTNTTTTTGSEGDGRDLIALVDWAEVGIHDGPTEIAQFAISNFTIDFRRANEKELVRIYWSTLVDHGVDPSTYPFDKCWNNYVYGGIERWLQMTVLMAYAGLTLPIPDPAIQWFHDQTLAFIEDHSADGESFPFLSVYPFGMHM